MTVEKEGQHSEHLKTLDEASIGEAYLLLSQAGAKFFSFAEKWAIFEPLRDST
jgi:hypothetical protein